MCKDHLKTRNRRIRNISDELATLLPDVLAATKCRSMSRLHGLIGCRHQDFLDVKHRFIGTSDEFLSLYLDALRQRLQPLIRTGNTEASLYKIGRWYHSRQIFRTYLELFLERTFLRNFDALARVKPSDAEAHYWIGSNNAEYGLFVSPRFNRTKEAWENDKSEIRRFKPRYFTVGHVLETGLVVPGKPRRRKFPDVEDYLDFFVDTLVRNAGSRHQNGVAERYASFVRRAPIPEDVPLLLPELRYLGLEKLHKYRLDFCVIDPFSLKKVGFELSPWSSHGKLVGTRTKSPATVNLEARKNREKELQKCEAYFNSRGIHVTVFTDDDLTDCDDVFGRIQKYLQPVEQRQQMLLHSRKQLRDAKLFSARN